MKAFIYRILNKSNNKFYIGSTIRKKHIRKYEHFSMLRENRHYNSYLQNSWNKYGENSFVFEVIEEFIFPENYSKEYIMEYIIARESFKINSLSAEYNLRHQENVRLNYHHSEETKAKIRQSNTGKKRTYSKEWLEKIRANALKKKGTIRHMSKEWRDKLVQIGKNSKGKKHSQEAINKISARSNQMDNIERLRILQKEQSIKRIGTHKSLEEKMKIAKSKMGNKIIEIYDLNMNLIDTAYSSHDASVKTGVSRSAISNNLVGICNKTRSYIFKYKEVISG